METYETHKRVANLPGENETTNDVSVTESAAPVADTSSIAPETTSPSDTSSGEQSKETLLDAVLKVVEPTTDATTEEASTDTEDPPSSTEGQTEDQAEDDTADEAKQEDDPVDDEEPPPEVSSVVRKKMNRLLNDRRQLRAEVSALKPHAEVGEQLHNFAQTRNLSPSDMVEALELAATLKAGDFTKFYEMVSPAVRAAQEQLGLVLPPDLQQRVEQGQMTVEAAQDFAKLRFQQRQADFRVRETEQASRTQQVERLQSDVHRAISSFEQRLLANDPDYKAIAEPVRRAAQAMLFERGGQFRSVEEALQIAKAAYDEVKATTRKLQKPLKATAPTPNGSNPQTPSARAAPKSLMEAALQGLAEARRAG